MGADERRSRCGQTDFYSLFPLGLDKRKKRGGLKGVQAQNPFSQVITPWVHEVFGAFRKTLRTNLSLLLTALLSAHSPTSPAKHPYLPSPKAASTGSGASFTTPRCKTLGPSPLTSSPLSPPASPRVACYPSSWIGPRERTENTKLWWRRCLKRAGFSSPPSSSIPSPPSPAGTGWKMPSSTA